MTERAPVGVFGGTFDPVHIGHLRLALEAREALDLAAVRLIPLAAPNHREPPHACGRHRLEMLRAAVADTALMADDRELARGGTSYTIDTLQSLRIEDTVTPLCLLLGRDAFAGLCTWHRWEELLDVAHIVVLDRPEAETRFEPRLAALVERTACDDARHLRQRAAGHIYFQSIPLIPVSSTDIRARVRSGRDIRYLVPDAVRHLILQHDLYRGH